MEARLVACIPMAEVPEGKALYGMSNLKSAGFVSKKVRKMRDLLTHQ